MAKKRKKGKRKYPNFQLDWNINNLADFNNALDAFDDWAFSGAANSDNLKVKDVISKANPSLYAGLSRGDKCRVGRAVSKRFTDGYYSELKRGDDKGATKTYYIG